MADLSPIKAGKYVQIKCKLGSRTSIDIDGVENGENCFFCC